MLTQRFPCKVKLCERSTTPQVRTLSSDKPDSEPSAFYNVYGSDSDFWSDRKNNCQAVRDYYRLGPMLK